MISFHPNIKLEKKFTAEKSEIGSDHVSIRQIAKKKGDCPPNVLLKEIIY